MIVLHWVMHRKHYEPVIPLVDSPGAPRAEGKSVAQKVKRHVGILAGQVRQRQEPTSFDHDNKHVGSQGWIATSGPTTRKRQRECDQG